MTRQGQNFVILPVAPGTFLRMFPERHLDGRLLKESGWWTRSGDTYYEGHPVFEVESYVLDSEGGHVTFQRSAGTFYVLGGGHIVDRMFPYPHPMFEVIDADEAEHIRSQMKAAAANRIARRSRSWWPDWLRLAAMRFARA